MFLKWIPWRYFVRSAARRAGFFDPIELLARLRKFSQPSEVQEPIELLRAGTVFHARGLINTKVIQNNLDWHWPWWVSEQFDPRSSSFIPRGFSFSHINLTHRNWTAVGIPGMFEFPVVDPRGLVIPRADGWSVDHWFLPSTTGAVLPAELPAQYVKQWLDNSRDPVVITEIDTPAVHITSRVGVEAQDTRPALVVELQIQPREEGRLVAAVRPFNPEGVRFVESVDYSPTRARMRVDGENEIIFADRPDDVFVSRYEQGDIDRAIRGGRSGESIQCPVGLATGAAVWNLTPGTTHNRSWRVPLVQPAEPVSGPVAAHGALRSWQQELRGAPSIEIPDPRWSRIWDASLRTLLLLSPGDVYPGPWTYRRFWFRDACLMMNALLATGHIDAVERSLERFPPRQKFDGYFHSQEGEWDSNGQVLWIADRYEQCSGRRLSNEYLDALEKAADWIIAKRHKGKRPDRAQGLFPAGFSAEHLGPNDYYFWDDFWGVGGLLAASRLFERRDQPEKAQRYRQEAKAFLADIHTVLRSIPIEQAQGLLPASPFRRMDSGAIGSLVADYPLALEGLEEDLLTRTADWLYDHCLVHGGFFQDMIHSGINAYLTLALAQRYLRVGDERWFALTDACADAASPTGLWPEAVHPQTGGGCMGDGQHGWAASEWLLMMRALFVRETPCGLEIGAGWRRDWLERDERLFFGPTPTPWGTVSIECIRTEGGREVHVEGDWDAPPPAIHLRMPGANGAKLPDGGGKCKLAL